MWIDVNQLMPRSQKVVLSDISSVSCLCMIFQLNDTNLLVNIFRYHFYVYHIGNKPLRGKNLHAKQSSTTYSTWHGIEHAHHML